MISVYFRVDADKKIGLGHLSRCRSLMLNFLNFTACRFAIETNNKEVVKNFVPHIDFNLYDVGHSFKEKHFDIAIVDLLNISLKEKKHLESLSDLIVCIDDVGPGFNGQDVLIRPNLLKPPKSLNIKIPLYNYWSGRDYIMMYPDFALQARKNKKRNKKVTQVLVCFGGSDPGGLTLRVIRLLKKLKNHMKVHVVLGAAFTNAGKIVLTLKKDPRFLISHNIPNMAQTLSKADLALISAGTLLYEACSLGIPALVISQNKPQEREAVICDNAGAVLNLGEHETVSDRTILRTLEQLLVDSALREKMSRIGPKIITPNGTKRIVSKLLAYRKRKVKQ